MNAWKLRFLLIGGINAFIGFILLILRGFSVLIIGYITVGIVIFLIGLIWRPKVKTRDNLTN